MPVNRLSMFKARGRGRLAHQFLQMTKYNNNNKKKKKKNKKKKKKIVLS